MCAHTRAQASLSTMRGWRLHLPRKVWLWEIRRTRLRCGRQRIAKKESLRVLWPRSMRMTAVVADTASLKHKGMVLERQKINEDIRNEVFSWLAANKYSFVPSESNCFMVDVKRPGKQFIEAMEAKKVYIGRVWPAWPTHARVTVGTGPEMEVFKKAFKEAMETPALAV